MNSNHCYRQLNSVRETVRFLLRTTRPLIVATAYMTFLLGQASNATASPPTQNFYVAHDGDGTTGKDWQHAFKELDKIDWSVVKYGDTIYVAGGVYKTPLVFQQSGVTVRNGAAPHNGQVDLDGSSTSAKIGINFGNYDYVQILGTPQTSGSNHIQGFAVYNYQTGVYVGPSSYSAHLEYCSIRANKQMGINTSGYLIVDRSNIHDNGANIWQTESPGSNYSSYLICSQNWIFNSNYPNVGPGIRVTGDANSAWQATVVDTCVMGPCLLRGVAEWSPNDVLTVSNSLFLDAEDANIRSNSQHTNVDKITSFMTPHNFQGDGHNCVNLVSGASVTNSIFYGGNVIAPAGTKLGSPNDQFNTTGNTTALSSKQVDPGFETDVSSYDRAVPPSTLEADDFTPSTATAKGTSLTSLDKLTDMLFD